MMYFTKHNPIVSAMIATVVMVPLVAGMFLTLEPTVTLGQSEEFTVRQEVTEEIAFTVAPQNVTMDQAIQGVTGGTANGSTTFEITTNNSSGYNVTIAFASTTAMEYESGSAYIPNLGTSVVADFNTSAVPGTSAFGYTVVGAGTVQVLEGTTGGCNTGSPSSDACFMLQADATSAFTIIDSNVASEATGDVYDLYFRVVADGNPNPALPEGFYTATATLTAANNA